jgi:hypothetical protein
VTPVERIYDLDGGIAEVADASIYAPGIDVGKPVTLTCNAYLIRRAGQWILWDTGTGDDLVHVPGGRIIAHGIRGVVTRTVKSQLDEIGVDPKDIAILILSHAHFDHVGNTRMFPHAKWIVPKIEYEAMFGPNPDKLGYLPRLYETLRHNPTEIIEGDHDVFGDGSVRDTWTHARAFIPGSPPAEIGHRHLERRRRAFRAQLRPSARAGVQLRCQADHSVDGQDRPDHQSGKGAVLDQPRR